MLTYQLANGIRLVHQQTPSKVISCGLYIHVGTRNELPNEHGMAHLLEHCLFKGTKKRSAFQINNRLEVVGGELNAFTSKEETCIHANCLSTDFARAVELIADITFNASLPEIELEKEKLVVCEEIDSYKDTPSEQIFDDFEDLLFQNTSLGHNILGTPQKIKRYTTDMLRNFINRNYTNDCKVFASVGNISPAKFLRHCETYFGVQASTPAQQIPASILSIQSPSFSIVKKKHTYQSHAIIGAKAYPYKHAKRLTLTLLINYLGGGASNTLFNQVLREDAGLVYTVEASYTPYSDTGVVMIYFACAKHNLQLSSDLIRKELQKLQQHELSPFELRKIKKQFLCQYMIASENSEQLMLSLAKNVLYQQAETGQQVEALLQNITAKDIQDVACEIFAPQLLSQLVYE